MSDDLRGERHDLHEPLLAQLASYGAEDARGPRLALIRDEHGGVLVEADVGAVLPLRFLGGPHDHRPRHLALLDLAGGDGVLDRDDHDVAQPRVAALRAAQDADHERLSGARVARDLEDRLLLHHGPVPSSARPLDNFDHPPPLRLRERPRLHDAYGVAHLRALLVVRVDPLGTHHLLAVEAVRESPRQGHGDGLLRLVTHHHARANLAARPHADFLSRKMVSMRAMSRRMVRNCNGFGIASVPRRNASRNRSSWSSASFCSSSSVLSSRSASDFSLAISALLAPYELRF